VKVFCVSTARGWEKRGDFVPGPRKGGGRRARRGATTKRTREGLLGEELVGRGEAALRPVVGKTEGSKKSFRSKGALRQDSCLLFRSPTLDAFSHCFSLRAHMGLFESFHFGSMGGTFLFPGTNNGKTKACFLPEEAHRGQ